MKRGKNKGDKAILPKRNHCNIKTSKVADEAIAGSRDNMDQLDSPSDSLSSDGREGVTLTLDLALP